MSGQPLTMNQPVTLSPSSTLRELPRNSTAQVGQTVVAAVRHPVRPLTIWFQAGRSAPAFTAALRLTDHTRIGNTA